LLNLKSPLPARKRPPLRRNIGRFELLEDRVVPTTADVVDVLPDPRNTDTGVIMVNFDVDVTGVDINDFTLTRDGNPIDITGGVVLGGPSQYTIDLSAYTGVDGMYVFTLVAAGSGIMVSVRQSASCALC
jgi:hypothetical protein